MSLYQGLLRTLFVSGLVILLIQSAHHAYAKWLGQTQTALLKDSEEPGEGPLGNLSLQELLEEYREAQERVRTYQRNQDNPAVPDEQKSEVEPYRSERRIKEALEEKQEEETRTLELRFFWISGLAFILGGVILYRKVNLWTGLALIIAGFVLMMTYQGAGFPHRESGLLVTYKLVLSLTSIALLLVTGFFLRGDSSEPPGGGE